MNAVEISRTALNVEWQRIEISARNLANMNSTRDANGDVYRPLRLVSGPELSFSALLEAGASPSPTGVRVMGVEVAANAFRRVLEPGHPHADADGLVTYPNVDHAGEMTLMIRATRAYEANLAAISIAQDMYGRALDLGRSA